MDNQDYSSIGTRIKEIRLKVGMMQAEFSDTLDITVSSLSELENNKRRPGFDFLFNMGQKLNVNLNYLLYGQGEPFIDTRDGVLNFLKANPFDSNEKDVLEILYYMKHSSLYFRAVASFSKEYFYRNKNFILKETKENKKNQESGSPGLNEPHETSLQSKSPSTKRRKNE